MEVLKRSLIYFFAAGLYFFHLGAWTYRMEGFTLSELASYPAEVMEITYAYVGLIIVFLTAGLLLTIKSRVTLRIALGMLLLPAMYETYRIFDTLSVYGQVESELFWAHLGIRLCLASVVVCCFYHGWQLNSSFNKSLQPTADASAE